MVLITKEKICIRHIWIFIGNICRNVKIKNYDFGDGGLFLLSFWDRVCVFFFFLKFRRLKYEDAPLNDLIITRKSRFILPDGKSNMTFINGIDMSQSNWHLVTDQFDSQWTIFICFDWNENKKNFEFYNDRPVEMTK